MQFVKVDYNSSDNYKVFQSKHYRVDLCKVDEIIETLLKNHEKSTEFRLDPEEVVEGAEVLEIFKCSHCKGIPLSPIKECAKCEVLFCGRCLPGLEKCPGCKKQMGATRQINRQLMHVTGDKLKFKHRCKKAKEEKEGDDPCNQKEIGQKLIEEKDGIAKPEPPAEAVQEEYEEAELTLSYDEMNKHLQRDCLAQNTFKCPNSQCHSPEMNVHQLRQHLIDDCQRMEVQCPQCYRPSPRAFYTKHDNTLCISYLQGIVR